MSDPYAAILAVAFAVIGTLAAMITEELAHGLLWALLAIAVGLVVMFLILTQLFFVIDRNLRFERPKPSPFLPIE